MAHKAFTITEASDHSRGVVVDRDKGIIRDVKILGLISENNRRYLPEAVKSAKHLYEGIKVNINHPDSSNDQRNAEDRFGKLINVYFVEGEGLYGDLMFLKSHPMAERVCEAAERMTDVFGLSHNAQGDGVDDKDGCFVINEIVSVRHVDLVSDPATTKSLSEAIKSIQETGNMYKPEDDKYFDESYVTIAAIQGSIKQLLQQLKKSSSLSKAAKQSIAPIVSKIETIASTLRGIDMKINVAQGDHQHAEESIKVTKEAGEGGIVRPIFISLDGNVKQALSAIKSARKTAASIKGKLKGSAGAKLYDLLNKIVGDAEGAVNTAIMQLHSAQIDPSWIESKESDMPYDKEMPEEQDVAEADIYREKLDQLKEVVNSIEEADDILGRMAQSGAKLGPKAKRKVDMAIAKLGEVDRLLSSMGHDDLSEADDIFDEEPAMSDEDPSEEVEPEMEEEELDKKTPMESKRIIKLCRANGIKPTKGLLEDFNGLSLASIKRHIGRLKLAKLSRAPRSSAPASSEISESKIPTDVFSWLRS